MKVLFGLGNPGRKYEKSRHNIGCRIVREFAKEENIRLSRSLSLGVVWGKRKRPEGEIRVVLPQTYMNLSGKAVLRCVQRWHVAREEMLIVVDDLHLPLGELRIRPQGSDGGQKGLRSVIEHLGSGAFPRLRFGIGSEGVQEPWESFVLKPFRREEWPVVERDLKQAVACCRFWAEQGIGACMNRFNRKGSSEDGTV